MTDKSQPRFTTLEQVKDKLERRIDVALEEKEDANDGSWIEKRSIVRINCFDLVRRMINKEEKRMSNEQIQPDAIITKCRTHCQKEGVNLYQNGEHVGDRYGDGTRESTFKGNIGCNVKLKPLFSVSTIEQKAESFCDKLDNEAKDGLTDSEKQQLEDVKSEIRRFAEVFS